MGRVGRGGAKETGSARRDANECINECHIARMNDDGDDDGGTSVNPTVRLKTLSPDLHLLLLHLKDPGTRAQDLPFGQSRSVHH